MGIQEKLFVESVPAHFKCSICTEVLEDPQCCREGHIFCKRCIFKWLSRSSTCPTCRTPLPRRDLHSSLLARNLIGELQVHCLWKDGVPGSSPKRRRLSEDSSDRPCVPGCPWLGTVASLGTHRRKCEFRPMQCACGAQFTSGSLDDHRTHCQEEAVSDHESDPEEEEGDQLQAGLGDNDSDIESDRDEGDFSEASDESHIFSDQEIDIDDEPNPFWNTMHSHWVMNGAPSGASDDDAPVFDESDFEDGEQSDGLSQIFESSSFVFSEDDPIDESEHVVYEHQSGDNMEAYDNSDDSISEQNGEGAINQSHQNENDSAQNEADDDNIFEDDGVYDDGNELEIDYSSGNELQDEIEHRISQSEQLIYEQQLMDNEIEQSMYEEQLENEQYDHHVSESDHIPDELEQSMYEDQLANEQIFENEPICEYDSHVPHEFRQSIYEQQQANEQVFEDEPIYDDHNLSESEGVREFDDVPDDVPDNVSDDVPDAVPDDVSDELSDGYIHGVMADMVRDMAFEQSGEASDNSDPHNSTDDDSQSAPGGDAEILESSGNDSASAYVNALDGMEGDEIAEFSSCSADFEDCISAPDDSSLDEEHDNSMPDEEHDNVSLDEEHDNSMPVEEHDHVSLDEEDEQLNEYSDGEAGEISPEYFE
eukprot:883722_1